MKKIVCIFTVLFLLVSSAFAAPSDDDVIQTFEGVMAVFGTVAFASMTGQELDGISVDMDMSTGEVAAIFDNLDVESLFALFGGAVPMENEMPEIPFSHLSGLFSIDAEQNLMMDLSFTGGPVKTMLVRTSDDDILDLVADGRSYSHLSSSELMSDFED